jgi:hypothetical protein
MGLLSLLLDVGVGFVVGWSEIAGCRGYVIGGLRLSANG